MTISQKDASTVGIGFAKTIQTIAGTSMFADSPIVLPDETWLVDAISLRGFDPNSAISTPDGTLTGIYLCPSGTQTPGSGNPPNSKIPDILQQLGFEMLSTNNYSSAGSGGGVTWWALPGLARQFVVPPSCFLRGIWSSGGVATLPTVGAILQMCWSYTRRKVCAA